MEPQLEDAKILLLHALLIQVVLLFVEHFQNLTNYVLKVLIYANLKIVQINR